MEKLIKKISDEITRLNDMEIPYIDEVRYLRLFLEKYKIYDIETYNSFSKFSYLSAMILVTSKNITLKDLEEKIDILEPFIENVDGNINGYHDYINILNRLNDIGVLEKIYNNKLKNLSEEEKRIYDEYTDITRRLADNKYDDGELWFDEKINKAMIELFLKNPNPQTFTSFTNINLTYENVIGYYQETFEDMVNDKLNDYPFINSRSCKKQVKRIKSEFLKKATKRIIDEYNLCPLKKDYEKMNEYFLRTEKIAKEQVRLINGQISKLGDLYHKLVYINNDRLIDIDEKTEMLLYDPELRNLFLNSALEHNLNIYGKALEKNIEYNTSDVNKLDITFNKYGYSFNDFNNVIKAKIINLNNINRVDEIISQIRYSELSFVADYIDEFGKMILYSNVNMIKNLSNCLKNKIINKEFIFKNKEILYDCNKYDEFIKCINYFNVLGIKTESLRKNDMDLLLDSNRLIEQATILKSYGFDFKSENLNFDIFKSGDALDILDNFIELNLGDIAINNSKYLIQDGNNVIKRIMIANLIGMDYLNNSNVLIGPIATGNNFYVNSKYYDDYIIDYKEDYLNPDCVNLLQNSKRNKIIANNEIINKLDGVFLNDKYSYKIGNTLISRNRVLRNLEVLLKSDIANQLDIYDIIYQAILYKMIDNVEIDELIVIYNMIKSLEFSKDKIYSLK